MLLARSFILLWIAATLTISSKAQAIATIPAKQIQLSSSTIAPIIVPNAKSDSLRKRPFTYRDNRILQALVVVDGKVIAVKKLSKINPQRIANVEVFKGAQAIAMFGSKGANGVIIITMRKY